MSFDVVTSSFESRRTRLSAVQWGFIVGSSVALAAVYVPLVGLTKAFAGKHIYQEAVNLGQIVTLFPMIAAGYLAWSGELRSGSKTASAMIAGCTAIAGPLGLILLIQASTIRWIFFNASPETGRLLTYDIQGWPGVAAAALIMACAFLSGILIRNLPPATRALAMWVCFGVLAISTLQNFLSSILTQIPFGKLVSAALFSWEAPTLLGLFAGAFVGVGIWAMSLRRASGRRARTMTAVPLPAAWIGAGVLAAIVAVSGGPFVAQIVLIVCIYVIMGFGLNIEVGFAGLLDLGFVAFFAIGAYTVALLTANNEFSLGDLSFWIALPIAGSVAVLAGLCLGLPVLRVRGDYLAVATMGLGEIVRVLVVSDALKPFIGGSQGLLGVPKPELGGYRLASPVDLALVAISLAGLAVALSYSLQNSRLGRRWKAIRDDEEAAQSLGVNLVTSKLFAYGIGAAFAGIAGGLFAATVGSVFPHSFQLIVSINVLALIILGGLGSIPGVVIGGLTLVGLPEILREFGEFRFLLYGFVLVLIMRVLPEGLSPATIVVSRSNRK